MALQIPKNCIFECWWPVRVKVPTDNGEHKTQRFKARFRIMNSDEAKKLVEDDMDVDLMNKVLIDWKDIEDADTKASIPFNDETKPAIIAVPFIRLGLVEAYFTAAAKAPRKN